MVRKIFYIKLLIIISNYFRPIFAEFKLKSVNVVFRHGDRTPEKLYAKDIHNAKSFYPVPLGGLINTGKRREYELGKFLRNTYDAFLGQIYHPDDVYARTTDFDRTQMSLLLVLAALYPPNDVQRWMSNLNWQPIPILIFNRKTDGVLHPSACPNWKEEMKRVRESSEFKKEESQFHDLMKKMSKYTGEKISGTNRVMGIFHTLTAELAMNLELPKWTANLFPVGPIIDATIFEYKATSYNRKLRRLNGGTIVRKMFDDMGCVKKGKKVPKIFLYSAHEMTVAAVLFALNVWKPMIPEYSSAVIVELWENGSKLFVRVVYYRGIPPEAEVRTIPGCAEYCPLKDFEKLMQDVMPDDIDRECYGTPNA